MMTDHKLLVVIFREDVACISEVTRNITTHPSAQHKSTVKARTLLIIVDSLSRHNHKTIQR